VDEALGLAIRSGRIWFGADIPVPKLAASRCKCLRAVGSAAVGHDAGDGGAEAGMIDHCRNQFPMTDVLQFPCLPFRHHELYRDRKYEYYIGSGKESFGDEK
jgi:hypothetical protein